MTIVRAKKNLGQHFLKDKNIARKIVESLSVETRNVLEVGPGMGVLTQFLLEKKYHLHVVEIDDESVEYLENHFPQLQGHIISGDFLRLDLQKYFSGTFSVIGNFPYNISSQIFFKVLENREQIPQVVGMVQKEVAERIAATHGSKTYGILSVLLQAFYRIEYLFTVTEHVFIPPPKVKSAVIRLVRNGREQLECNEKLFFQVVKTAFNQRRKTMRNSLKAMITDETLKNSELLALRPEQLSVSDFELLTRLISEQPKNM
ncbi:MAG: 16S rRNA (adenine(1518)-N(6)/adenine(1519)-N(6))-dimethyltransferase RsmA [Prolixibacteraceae bacterium]|jgi:16S rRNA (adenine1518-N6/adenine1519-N6)-dimethyltransferase|nr:16S rRNA (adenine(1518)-N(6)/adenine(1519)-N(6))-dimethyltransferase RsmA [Prolixibacteraceae bacterium]